MYAICLTVDKANKRFTDAINSYSQDKLAVPVYSCTKKN